MRIDTQLLAGRSSKTMSRPDPAKAAGLNDFEDKRLKKACTDFEALFLSNLMKSMRKTVEKSKLFGSDSGEETFQEMMDDEVSKSAANTSSMGIGDMLYRQATNQMAKSADPVLLRQAQDAHGQTPPLIRQAQDVQGQLIGEVKADD